MDLRDISQEGEDLIHLAQNIDEWQDLVKTTMKLQAPKTWEFLSSFSGRNPRRSARRLVG